MKKPALILAGTILAVAGMILASKVGAETTLDPLKVGPPGKLTVAGKTSVTLSDVLVGDVWLGSGQSNRSRSVGRFAGGDDVLAAMAKAGPYPNLRLYKGDWKIAAADDIGGFSAIMFSFGLPLQKELDVPVGLIVGAVSGTASGRWLSPEMLLGDPGLKKLVESDEAGKTLWEELEASPKTLAKWEEAAKQAEADGKPLPENPQAPSHIGDLYARFIEPVVPYATSPATVARGRTSSTRTGGPPSRSTPDG